MATSSTKAQRNAKRPPAKSTAERAPAAAPGFATWKANALAALKAEHGIDAPTTRERDWRRAFIGGLPPDAAAEAAWRDHDNAARVTERRKR